MTIAFENRHSHFLVVEDADQRAFSPYLLSSLKLPSKILPVETYELSSTLETDRLGLRCMWEKRHVCQYEIFSGLIPTQSLYDTPAPKAAQPATHFLVIKQVLDFAGEILNIIR